MVWKSDKGVPEVTVLYKTFHIISVNRLFVFAELALPPTQLKKKVFPSVFVAI
jgi:hypothetical protein